MFFRSMKESFHGNDSYRYQNEKISEDDQLKINPNQNTNHVQLSMKEDVRRLM